jgi:hypothetical protein
LNQQVQRPPCQNKPAGGGEIEVAGVGGANGARPGGAPAAGFPHVAAPRRPPPKAAWKHRGSVQPIDTGKCRTAAPTLGYTVTDSARLRPRLGQPTLPRSPYQYSTYPTDELTQRIARRRSQSIESIRVRRMRYTCRPAGAHTHTCADVRQGTWSRLRSDVLTTYVCGRTHTFAWMRLTQLYSPRQGVDPRAGWQVPHI